MYIQRNIHPVIKSHLRRKEYTIDYRTTEKKEIDFVVTLRPMKDLPWK